MGHLTCSLQCLARHAWITSRQAIRQCITSAWPVVSIVAHCVTMRRPVRMRPSFKRDLHGVSPSYRTTGRPGSRSSSTRRRYHRMACGLHCRVLPHNTQAFEVRYPFKCSLSGVSPSCRSVARSTCRATHTHRERGSERRPGGLSQPQILAVCEPACPWHPRAQDRMPLHVLAPSNSRRSLSAR